MITHSVHKPNNWPLADRLRAYGCPDLIRLDKPFQSSAQIEYLDLLPPHATSAAVHAVAEHQGTALLYLLDTCDEPTSHHDEISRLQRQLANRSDPAWLGVVRPGSLELHPIGFHQKGIAAPLVTIREESPEAPLFFQNLVHGSLRENSQLQGSDYVFKKIYGLLTQTIDEYVTPGEESPVIPALDILSMAGRALFFRFLIDRRIIGDGELPEICPTASGLKDGFANAENAAHTSAWLDETFNGDFLRLIDESIPETDRLARHKAYLRYYEDIDHRAGRHFFNHLHAILNGWQAAGGGFQTELDWGDFDFAHIPVGVLSQVYESFSHRADPHTARSTSTHYTPRNVARLMVDQVFAATTDPTAAKVLDPACGAGIFLVLAFRRLVREHWRVNGKRPNTRRIQEILYRQLRGFDISEAALRLAALSLYITAIEVNGTQRPPKALKFPRDLRDTVLFHFGEDPKSSLTLGSLGPRVPSKFDGTFDIVIGNPPWTRLREKEPQSAERLPTRKAARSESARMNQEFTTIGRRALQNRGFTDLASAYENPDKNPDLPFLWRATEWAKKDRGTIAFALPARIFGRTSGKGFKAWRAILRCVSITGLINGADLRKTAVWEAVDLPFCLLFARNTPAPEDHRFFYTSPRYEPSQNQHARFRIDYEATRPVREARIEEQPWVLKALSLGTWRDVAVMEKILAAFPQSLATLWKAWNPKKDKTGKGYDLSPRLNQKPAAFLSTLLDFEQIESAFPIQFGELKTFIKKHGRENENGQLTSSANRPRTEELYQPPLVIVPQSPGDNPEKPRAFLSDRPLAFSQSFYGYSCAEHPDAETLAALLYLLVHSSLFSYYSLMTSRRTGFDRQTFNKEELDSIAFPDVCELPQATKNALRKLARRLEQDRRKPWKEIDTLLFDLYTLDDGDDGQVIRDTLFSAASYRRQGRAALEPTSRQNREPFRMELLEILQPFFNVCGEKVDVEEPPRQPDVWQQPWAFLTVSRAGETAWFDAEIVRQAMDEANRLSASRVLVRAPEQRGLLLGLLNQRRWWTRTRASLCGQHILRHHLEAFGLA